MTTTIAIRPGTIAHELLTAASHTVELNGLNHCSWAFTPEELTSIYTSLRVSTLLALADNSLWGSAVYDHVRDVLTLGPDHVFGAQQLDTLNPRCYI